MSVQSEQRRMPRAVTPSTILAAELDEVWRRLQTTPDVDAETLTRLARARDVAAGLDSYLDRCTTPESPALAELARRTQEADWTDGLEAEMLSGHVEGQALKFLVHMTRATRVLEIGMFTGYSALAMAEALPADGVLVACEIDQHAARFARQCFAASPSGKKITVAVAPAMETLGMLAERARHDQLQAFDLVFIDADKAGYLGYLEVLLDTDLLAPGAVIAVDNTLMQGQPYAVSGEPTANGAAIASFNAAVAADPRVEQVLLPVRDGLTLIRRADVLVDDW
ncbi:class I SAM-dependent methyltransferase [Mycobacterium sp. NPDC050551]|uniref:O-methyltransferase n=1 Tax=Mycobacterium sp. NPDC050551 TaxID=3155407 RepID=UPI0034261EE3